jgi:cytochrome P450
VARALFGADLSAVVDGFGAAVQAMNEFIGHYDPADRARYDRFQRARLMINGIVDGIVADRRATAEDDRGDFLSILLAARSDDGAALPARAVRDQVLTLLMAGHETTAKALTWTLLLLDRHPDVLESTRSEIGGAVGDAPPQVGDLPRLGAAWRALQEAMRLYPPVWVMSRVAAEDDVIDGWAIPRGTLVLVSPWALHRHPAHWEAPERFIPARFTAAADAARHPYAYVPFSGGPRQCIGKHFASLEAHLVLVRLLQRVQVRVTAVDVAPEALVTLRPRGGMPVVVHPLEATRV